VGALRTNNAQTYAYASRMQKSMPG
jgi:hypothetical protein